VAYLADLTTEEARALVAGGRVAVLVPIGSVEPHGPHLPLATDTIISERACARAVERLAERGITAVVAPAVPYGVTDYAAGFTGAIGVPADALTALLRGIAARLLADGFAHVCFVNNHLEPAHDAAIRAAATVGSVSVACPLTKRWGRTLTEEYKRGNCHAGQYETSLMLAAGAAVRPHDKLPPVETTLAAAGTTTFQALGLSQAYTGNPAGATREEGESSYDKLAEMIATEVSEALRRA
jgi:creatinine amidohydrolase